MTSGFALRPLTVETRPALERLWQLYRHDLSEFRGRHDLPRFLGTLPDPDGTFSLHGLLPFLDDDVDRGAYLFYRGTSPVGFALVTGLRSEPRLMSEFFVVRGLRTHGIGRTAASELFSLHPGEWEIPFQESNLAAARFWRGLAATLPGETAREELRPVPDKPHVPPDVWITVTVA